MRPADVCDMCRMAHILSKFGSWRYFWEDWLYMKKIELVRKLHSYSYRGEKSLNILQNNFQYYMS